MSETREDGIIGTKKSEYLDRSEFFDKALTEADMPSDVRFFLKTGKNPVGGVQKIVRLYEVLRVENGLKLRLEHCDTYTNRIPEDEEIALNFGPSKEGYKWIAKWLNARDEEVGIESKIIMISEKWRDRYDAFQKQKKQAAETDARAALAPPIPIAVPTSTGMGAGDILAFIREGEDRAIKMMERMAAVLKTTEGPASVMEKAYDAVGRFMEKSMQSNLDVAKKVADRAQMEMDPPEEEEAEEDSSPAAAKSDGMPLWLKPIMEKATDGLAHLLGGGPTGAVVKSMILSSAQWQEVFSDKDKFSTMTAEMRKKFGDEKVEKAMGILLNIRPEKAGKKKGGK